MSNEDVPAGDGNRETGDGPRLPLEFVDEGAGDEPLRRSGALPVYGDHVLVVVKDAVVDSDPGGVRMVGGLLGPHDAVHSVEIRVLVESLGPTSGSGIVRIVEFIEKHLDVLVVCHLGIRCGSVDLCADLVCGVVQYVYDGVDVRRPLVHRVLHPVVRERPHGARIDEDHGGILQQDEARQGCRERDRYMERRWLTAKIRCHGTRLDGKKWWTRRDLPPPRPN